MKLEGKAYIAKQMGNRAMGRILNSFKGVDPHPINKLQL